MGRVHSLFHKTPFSSSTVKLARIKGRVRRVGVSSFVRGAEGKVRVERGTTTTTTRRYISTSATKKERTFRSIRFKKMAVCYLFAQCTCWQQSQINGGAHTGLTISINHPAAGETHHLSPLSSDSVRAGKISSEILMAARITYCFVNRLCFCKLFVSSVVTLL